MTEKKSSKKAALDAYLKEARTWETDKVIASEKSKRLAWRIAILGLLLSIASVAAVLLLTPLKTVEPFVVRVDNTTGIVDVVKTLKGGSTTYDEAVNKYFVQRYVRAREGYNREIADSTYIEVGLMSSPNEAQRYYDFFNPTNAQSPLNVYRDYAKVRITVKSVSFINNKVALVRYVRAVDRPPDKPQLSHWAATVSYQYVGAPMSETDRAVNPLGFQVTDYRSDPESLTAVEGQRQARVEPTLAPAPDQPASEPWAAPPAPSAAPAVQDAPAGQATNQ